MISDRVTAFVSFDRRVPFGISEVSIESLQLHSFALLSAATSVRFIILAVGIGAMAHPTRMQRYPTRDVYIPIHVSSSLLAPST